MARKHIEIHSRFTVELSQWKIKFCGIIVPRQNQTTWRYELGKLDNINPQVEGVFIPLDLALLPNINPLYGKSFLRSEKESQELTQEFLTQHCSGLAKYFDCVPNSRFATMGNWVPVRVKDILPELGIHTPALKPVMGEEVILTFSNYRKTRKNEPV